MPWEKAENSISFNEKRYSCVRNIKLDGEAIFDVTSDPAHPFVVTAPQVRIKVLGTVFKIRDYSAESFSETTLAEGSIEMKEIKGGGAVTLSPGQKAILRDDTLRIEETDADNLSLMRYGIVSIVNAPLKIILSQFEQDFNVRLKVTAYEPKDSLFTINYVRDASVYDVLEMLETVSGVKVEIIE